MKLYVFLCIVCIFFFFTFLGFVSNESFLWNPMHINSLVKIIFKEMPKPDLELPLNFESVLRKRRQEPKCFIRGVLSFT